MSAIITQNFRLDTTERFVDSLLSTNDTYYIGLGRPNPWPITSEGFEVILDPAENDSTNNQIWQEMIAMTKLQTNDISFAAPRTTWSEATFDAYDDKEPDLESTNFMVITNVNFNVYICLRADGTSTISPDLFPGGIKTSGVMEMDDGYIWKYLFTLTTENANKFLTDSFIPVQRLESDPELDSNGDSIAAPSALVDQWNVQNNATPGAIYNIEIDFSGTLYDTSTITVDIVGNGTGATAHAVVSGGLVVAIHMDTFGSGYDYATITVNCSTGTGCDARAIMSPRGGFGYDPRYDIRSHYVLFNKSFVGDGDGVIPSTGDFRQITLIKNPIDASTGLVAAETYYNTCKSVDISGTFLPATIIESTHNGIYSKGFVVEKMGTSVYYIQNTSLGFGQFEVGGTETVTATGIIAAADSDIVFNSGEIMFLENRDKVSRSTDQTETIRLAIEF